MAKLNFDIFKQAGPSRTSVWVLLHSGELMGAVRDWFAGEGYELQQVL